MNQDNGVSDGKLDILTRIAQSKGVSLFILERVCNVKSLHDITSGQAYYLEILLSYVDINRVISINNEF